MTDDEADDDIIEGWISRGILGDKNIEALIGLGLVAGPPDDSASPLEFEAHEHELTGIGRVAIRDHATVLALSDCHDMAGGMDALTRGESSTKEYAPSRREFERLAEVARQALVEVVALRAEVARLKGGSPTC